MANKTQTEAAKFYSNYADGYVSAAQYITERICVKKAGSNDLPKRFWEIAAWKNYYKQQIIAANGLLKIYSPQAIIAALKHNKAYSIYSLRAPHLDQIIQDEECRLQLEKKEEIVVEKVEDVTFRKEKVKQNTISKLRDL